MKMIKCRNCGSNDVLSHRVIDVQYEISIQEDGDIIEEETGSETHIQHEHRLVCHDCHDEIYLGKHNTIESFLEENPECIVEVAE